MPIASIQDNRGRAPLSARNPLGQTPNRFNRFNHPLPIVSVGRSPGTQVVYVGGHTQAVGTIRRWWRQMVNGAPQSAPYNQVTLSTDTGNAEGVDLTRALRYKASTHFIGAGDDLKYNRMHTIVRGRSQAKSPSVAAGSVRGQPTVRNRLVSFGSRVPTLNGQSKAAQS